MLKAIWAARWYLLLGFFTFVIVLTINTPLHFVWRFIEPQAAHLPVRIEQPAGTIWNGRLQLRIPQLNSLGSLETQWQLSPLGLFAGRADLNLRIRGDGVRLRTTASLGSDQVLEIQDAEGFLEAAAVAPLLQRNRVTLGGNFELSQLVAALDLGNRAVTGVSGRLVYSGGEVGFPVNNKPVSATMPMLIGDLSMSDGRAVINVNTMEGQSLIQGYLQPDGWGGVTVRRRLLDVLGQQWPAQATEDTVIFEVSHKVL